MFGFGFGFWFGLFSLDALANQTLGGKFFTPDLVCSTFPQTISEYMYVSSPLLYVRSPRFLSYMVRTG